MSVRSEVQRWRGEAETSAGYRNYLRTRESVLEMLDQWPPPVTSAYWSEELEQFDYLFDAGPLVVRKLREHCHAITGLRAYDYRRHHEHRKLAFASKLAALRALDGEGLFVPESPVLGGFGHHLNDALVNIDTLKFYESLIALSHAGELHRLRNLGRPPVIWEIGSGWGGFAYQLKHVLPEARIVLVDLPQTFLFAGTYLLTALPGVEARFVTDPDAAQLGAPSDLADLTFIPSMALDTVRQAPADLFVNMVSFQEMTTEQVSTYIDKAAELACPVLYSHNRDRSPHNSELTTVSALIKRRYETEQVQVLPVPYTSLKVKAQGRDTRTWARRILAIARRVGVASSRGAGASETAYRHLIGRLHS